MTKEDYYDILGINKGANQTTIKKAYNRMIFTYHLDHAEGEEEKQEYRSKFRKIQEVYDILSDEDKKKEHDQQFKDKDNKGITEYNIKQTTNPISEIKSEEKEIHNEMKNLRLNEIKKNIRIAKRR